METVHRTCLWIVAGTSIIGAAQMICEEFNIPPVVVRVSGICFCVFMAVYILTRKRKGKDNRSGQRIGPGAL